MKAWADHSSSDEDEYTKNTSAPPAAHDDDDEPSLPPTTTTENDDEHPTDQLYPPQVPSFNVDPHSGPPFTAFIGNLSFDVPSANHLAYDVECLAKEFLDRRVEVSDGRLAKDKNTGKLKGFGYLEFQTPEELATVLELSLHPITLYGRKPRIDIASSRRDSHHRPRGGHGGPRDNAHHGPPRDNAHHSNIPQIDGSQFRGGRHNASHSSSRGGPPTTTSSAPPPTAAAAPPRHRPSLKLAPRTKPLERGKDAPTRGSGIFGDGRPREEKLKTKGTDETTNGGGPTPTSPTPTPAAAPPAAAASSVAAPPPAKNPWNLEKNTAPPPPPPVDESTPPPKEDTTTTAERQPPPQKDRPHRNNNDRRNSKRDSQRRSGRGGRSGAGRGGGGGGDAKNKRRSDYKKNPRGGGGAAPAVDADGWGEAPKGHKPVAMVVVTEPAAEVKKEKKSEVINKFAALGFESSDSD